jgi:hypothetical protein
VKPGERIITIPSRTACVILSGSLLNLSSRPLGTMLPGTCGPANNSDRGLLHLLTILARPTVGFSNGAMRVAGQSPFQDDAFACMEVSNHGHHGANRRVAQRIRRRRPPLSRQASSQYKLTHPAWRCHIRDIGRLVHDEGGSRGSGGNGGPMT